MQKQIDDQQKTIWELRQEIANLKKKNCATKIGNGGCGDQKRSPEGVGSVGVLDTPPPSTFVPPIDLSRLGRPEVEVEPPRPRGGGEIV